MSACVPIAPLVLVIISANVVLVAGVGIHNNGAMEAAASAEIYEKMQGAVAFHLGCVYRECPCHDCHRDEHRQPTALNLALLTGKELAVIRSLYEKNPSELEHARYATTQGAAEGVVEFLIDKEPDKILHSQILAWACEAGPSKEIQMIAKKFPDLVRQPYVNHIHHCPLYPISLAMAKNVPECTIQTLVKAWPAGCCKQMG